MPDIHSAAYDLLSPEAEASFIPMTQKPENAHISTGLSYLFALLVGACLAAYSFPLDYMLPTGVMELPVPMDMMQHVIGQRYFIADSWRWPLLVAENLNTPKGQHIAFTDSIPLLSIFLKIASPILPTSFHGIGLWYGISWLLQPVAAVWCVRAAGERRLLPAICAALLAASMPYWWNRFGHAALTGQFTLLVMLGFYFLLVHHQNARLWAFAAIAQAAILLIHPYLWAMTLPFILAVPVTLFLNRQSGWKQAMAGFIGCLGVSILLYAVLGYSGASGARGFGNFAMNLLSPIWPASSGLLSPPPPRLQVTEGSDWEGYAYLGGGVILGIILIILFRYRTLKTSIVRHAGLVLACLGLTVLAISNNIGIGPWIIPNLYSSPDILEQIRASARFFWPVGYVLMVATVLGLSAFRYRWLSAFCLVLVAVVQLADIRPMINGLHYTTRDRSSQWLVDAAGLRPIFAQSRQLTLLPRWNCMPGGDIPLQQHQEMQILTLASETALATNTMYEARWYYLLPCSDADVAASPFRPGEVRVLLPSVREELTKLIPDYAKSCQPVGELIVCQAGGAGPKDANPTHSIE